jgi:septal ring factor EnvC (AmiA/AmiB activator)
VSGLGASNHRESGESDWADQDLLTLEEARHRLEEEIKLTSELVEVARRSHALESDLAMLERRLNALLDAQRRNDAGPSDVMRSTSGGS